MAIPFYPRIADELAGNVWSHRHERANTLAPLQGRFLCGQLSFVSVF